MDIAQLIAKFYREKSSKHIGTEYGISEREICRLSDSTKAIMSSVDLKKLNKTEKNYVDDQLRMMSGIVNGHKNILKTFDVYYHEFRDSLLIMHELSKFPLENMISFYDGVEEDDAKKIFKQLLEGIQYLHEQDIVHGNISARSCFLKSYDLGGTDVHSTNIQLKLMLTNRGTKGRGTFDRKGTGISVVESGMPLVLLPPEAWKTNGTHSKEADMWNAGIILYTLLDGKRPWARRTDEDPKRLLKRERYGSMQSGYWQFASEDAKDLVRQLLKTDATIRFTADQALGHQWFMENNR